MMDTMGAQMWVLKTTETRWRPAAALALATLLFGCSSPPEEPAVQLMARDSGVAEQQGGTDTDCDNVTIDGDEVTVHEEDVTAHFTMVGEIHNSTVMIFGGDKVEFDNAVSNMALKALDQTDALVLAEKYEDFYLCSSPGGIEAQNYIVQYDLVPASCDVYNQLVAALRDFARNSQAGGDRVSLSFEGVELTLDSAAFDSSGMDVTDQLEDLNFHLVTKVEQITGESLIEFGMQ
jgi:hypothetical protein